MTPDERALLAAVAADPDDDLPRLVFADWLDEDGRADRAEFVRLQCDRARREHHDPAARGIGPREYQLLAAHGRAWRADDLPDGLRDRAVYRRGFVYRVRCQAGPLFRAWHAGAVLPPVERLGVTVSEVAVEWLAVPPPPMLPPLRELTVWCRLPVGADVLRLVARLGPYPRLTRLALQDPLLGDAAADLLAPGPAFPALAELDLSYCGIGDDGAEAFAVSGWAARLKRLVLTGNPITATRLDWLRARFGPALVV